MGRGYGGYESLRGGVMGVALDMPRVLAVGPHMRATLHRVRARVTRTSCLGDSEHPLG